MAGYIKHVIAIDVWLNLRYNLAIERSTYHADSSNERFKESVFVTKNGYGRLVVMDIEYYERTMQKINEANFINKGIADYEAGRVVEGKSALKRLREKHGV